MRTFIWSREPGKTKRREALPFKGEWLVLQDPDDPTRFGAVTFNDEAANTGFNARLNGRPVFVNRDSQVSQAFKGDAPAPRQRSLPISRTERQRAAEAKRRQR